MKIIINGINGRMGKEVARLVCEGVCNSELAAGVDIYSDNENIYTKLSDYTGPADCVIDFSSHLATKDLLNYCITRNLPVVVATTGHTKEETALIENAADKIPVFFSANMSLGVALLASLARTVAKTMPGANIEIVEKHHNRKLDVPSGTALLIAKEIKQELQDYELLVGRNENGKMVIYCRNDVKIDLSQDAEGDTGSINLPKSDAYANEINYFADCVINDTPVEKVKPEELACVLKILNNL